LALLPNGAGLVNVARGEVVVEKDLIEALQTGNLGSAYLDVFEHEPLSPSSALWSLPNVILTPHSAGFSSGNEARVSQMFLDNLATWAK
jgi:phosphoglycerate dehydrogenase-like enzyme